MNWDQAADELSKKLHPDAVQAPKQFGPKGHYIEGWHAIAEANRIFGFGEWSYTVVSCTCVSERPREIGRDKKAGFGVTYIATVRVDVAGVLREDVGAGHGYDIDCGLAHESAIKEAVTDSLKRALRTFGNPFGLALYDKSRENVGVDEPPLDPDAAAERIIKKFENATTYDGLVQAWSDESLVVAKVGEANAELGRKIYEVRNARKKALQEEKAAA